VGRAEDPGDLELLGVRTRNLKDVDVRFPRGKWTSLCGVSGSGKTSLAFHTLHAEAERRWLSTLPAWRRLLSDALPRPELRSCSGLSPTAALRQEPQDAPGSALESLCGLREPLAALWAAASTPISPTTGEPMVASAPAEVAEAVLERLAGERIQVQFRPSDLRPGTWVRRGFVRASAHGLAAELERLPADEEIADLRVTVDRVVADRRSFGRICEAAQSAYRLGDDSCLISDADGARELLRFSGIPRCTATGRSAPRPVPGLFSPRSPHGACRACAGSGGDGTICPSCGGSGLREEAGWFRLAGQSLPELRAMESERILAIVSGPAWEPVAQGPCRELVLEIRNRFSALVDLGLGYLSPGREARTLSQGEERRARLAALVGSPLSGIAYVLDEPTTGLHPLDLPPVHRLLSRLRDGGATLVVVEHDLRSLALADHVVETGPGPGASGGLVLYSGGPEGIVGADTPSGRWLSGRSRPLPRKTRSGAGRILLRGILGRNLSIPELEVPLGSLVAVTGVSGAGKSSLVLDALAPALERRGRCVHEGVTVESIEVEGALDEVRPVEALGEWTRSPRSTVATVSGMLDELRTLLASLPEAKARGWGVSRFSPNAKGGRCERCEGIGQERIRLHLLPDAWVPCSRCGGTRFESSTLEVLWKGLSIADILDLPLDRAAELFANHPRLGPLCAKLARAGLSHLSAGRRTDSLSGGEALRLRLCASVALPSRKKILWILDEPSRGLHPQDVMSLLSVLEDLLEAGHGVVATTHDPLLISRCDRVLELGPGPGSQGGRLLFSGTPQELAADSWPSSASVARELA
jgi:excinuclease ABC subunit A